MYNVFMPIQAAPLKGHLKLFLGYSQNHANTRSMLLAGLQQQSQGKHVFLLNHEQVLSQIALDDDLRRLIEQFPKQVNSINTYPQSLFLIENTGEKLDPDTSIQDILAGGNDVYATLEINQLIGDQSGEKSPQFCSFGFS